MQLTKDDVTTMGTTRRVRFLDFSKFLEVRKFYEKYKESSDKLKRDYPEIFEQFWESLGIYGSGVSLKDWLFFYCFVEGLK